MNTSKTVCKDSYGSEKKLRNGPRMPVCGGEAMRLGRMLYITKTRSTEGEKNLHCRAGLREQLEVQLHAEKALVDQTLTRLEGHGIAMLCTSAEKLRPFSVPLDLKILGVSDFSLRG